jgi:hypothetical protein
MSIKNLGFSYWAVLSVMRRKSQFICFIVYFYVLRFRIRASHGGIFPWNGDGGEYLLLIEELLSKPS